MFYSLAQQQYQYSHGMSPAEQRAANARMGEAAAALRDLRHGLGRVFGARLARTAVPAATAAEVRPAAPARVLAGVR